MPSLKSFYRFNLRLLFLTVIGFALSSLVYSQFQIKAKYSETESKPSRASSAKIRLDDETQTPHNLVGGFYTTRNGFESKLMMNNKGPQPIDVSPTLYGENGAIMQMPIITVERNSFITVNLRDWANFAGEEFRQGNIRLFHRGKDLVLGCNILIIDESKSLIFENKLSELGRFDSRHLDSVWWIPGNDTDSTVVLTNTGDELLTVTATLTKNPHNSSSAQTFILLPHQIKVLNVKEDFTQGNVFAKAKVLSLSLTHDGTEESLLAWAMIKNESKGYSNIATFTNPTKAKSNQYHGAGLQLGSVGNDQLEPVVVLRNTTDAKVDVNVKVPYTKQDGSKGTVSINTVKLNPHEVHQVNMQKAANLNNVKTAGIEIEYTGNPGSVVASAQSVSESGTQVFRTLLWDAPALKSASSMYPFSIEGTSSTKAYIKNAGFKDETYVSHITWGADGEYVIPMKTIKKGETVEIDVKKIRDEQIPDERGRTIPLDVSKGQIHWLLRRSDSTEEEARANKVPLIGQALQVDTAKGVHYSYFCLSCCEYMAYSFGTLVPSNAQAQYPVSFQYQILEDGTDCYGNTIYSRNITHLGYDWTSTNTSVATVNNGYATTQGGGQTQIKVKVNLPRSMYYGDCSGGPVFAGMKNSAQECNEDVRPAKARDAQAVSFSKVAFKKESKRNIALRPDDCDCITYSPTRTLTADLTVEPQITLNVPQTAQDGDTVTFSVTVQGGTPTSYQWSFDAPQGAGNNPQVNFSSPNNGTTTALAHWFALPNQPCASEPPPLSSTHPYYNSTYQIKVKVTFSGGLEITKQMPFTVNAYWNPGGSVGPPQITGYPSIAPNAQNMWVVTGPNNLTRVPQQAPIMNLPSTSQFYNKILAHENVHISQWNPGQILQNYVTVNGFMAQISNLTDTTQAGLVQQINQAYLNYVQSEVNTIISSGDRDRAEIDAYNVSDPIAPMYAYQRCGRTTF